jgi:hypothetical protein
LPLQDSALRDPHGAGTLLQFLGKFFWRAVVHDDSPKYLPSSLVEFSTNALDRVTKQDVLSISIVGIILA